jgi:hypothetical protein
MISAPNAGVELKSISGVLATVELAVGEQMRTPGLSGAAHAAAAIAGRTMIGSKSANKKRRILPPWGVTLVNKLLFCVAPLEDSTAKNPA